MNHKDMTAHIRNRIKVAGIKAKVKMQEFCGYQVVAIDVPAYEIEFTAEEQRAIRHIAKCNGLTLSQGMEINVDLQANPKDFKFYFGAV